LCEDKATISKPRNKPTCSARQQQQLLMTVLHVKKHAKQAIDLVQATYFHIVFAHPSSICGGKVG